jgi:hypothetical protein
VRHDGPRLGGRSPQRRPGPDPPPKPGRQNDRLHRRHRLDRRDRHAAANADLLIAEGRYRNKNIPYHLRLADLDAHRDRLTPRRVVITHMSADVLNCPPGKPFEPASDGLIVSL